RLLPVRVGREVEILLHSGAGPARLGHSGGWPTSGTRRYNSETKHSPSIWGVPCLPPFGKRGISLKREKSLPCGSKNRNRGQTHFSQRREKWGTLLNLMCRPRHLRRTAS